MNKTLLFFFSLSIVLSACTQPESKVEVKKRIAKGNRAYGGTFKLNENEECQTLFPYSIIDAVSSRIVAQIYEGLVKKSSKDLSIKPSIAESWEIDTTGTIYTFKLKKGIYFHDDPCFPNGKGREVTAQDFKFSFEMLCTQKINDSIENVMFAQTLKNRVLGANKFYEASKKGKPNFDLEGVKVIDDYTLQITLSKPNMSFIYILAYPEVSVIPREGLEKYGEMLTIGTGPFVFFDWYEEDNKETGESEEFLVLTRNENYHGYDTLGNQLPYLDTIFTSFINSQKRELKMFQEKKLDIVLGIPAESIRDIVEQQIAYFEKKPPEFILERSADMATNYYSFILGSNGIGELREKFSVLNFHD
ncbi:MAG: ABC transporter substrate-binding protein [Candidatus Marinimicrobia bacterium]|nr:ABC transporter substrate-binding protein [Candidatus Neomarinimicrobiota bacterium]